MTEIPKTRAAAAEAPSRQALVDWVEQAATFFADSYGLPPITGRILGWLMICEPAEQSAAEIAEAIGASRASLTTNMRLLTGSGLVRRVTRAGERTAYYRHDDNAWEEVLRRRMAGLAALTRITREGLDLVGPQSDRAGRLRGTHVVFAWAEELLKTAPGPSRRVRSD